MGRGADGRKFYIGNGPWKKLYLQVPVFDRIYIRILVYNALIRMSSTDCFADVVLSDNDSN